MCLPDITKNTVTQKKKKSYRVHKKEKGKREKVELRTAFVF